MKELVIGGDGFIGSRLMQLAECEGTSRKNPTMTHMHPLDLLQLNDFPRAEITYICAGVNGARWCEGNQDAFRINVDAPIEIARLAQKWNGFCVYISSMSLEWFSSTYARHKMAAETVLRTMPNVGIVRSGRVITENRDELCAEMMRVGRERVCGVTRWGNDDIPYRKG